MPTQFKEWKCICGCGCTEMHCSPTSSYCRWCRDGACDCSPSAMAEEAMDRRDSQFDGYNQDIGCYNMYCGNRAEHLVNHDKVQYEFCTTCKRNFDEKGIVHGPVEYDIEDDEQHVCEIEDCEGCSRYGSYILRVKPTADEKGFELRICDAARDAATMWLYGEPDPDLDVLGYALI